jgi:NitT/TauT family transport system substrate-binding protein
MLWADVANTQGYFNDVGLKPTFKYFTNGTDVAKTVVAKSVDIGGMPPTTAVAQLVSQGVPLVMVAGMDVQDWVIGVSDPAIKTCQDLKGEPVATDGPGNARNIFLTVFLKSCGLTANDVKPVGFGGANAAAEAAASGQLKAAVLHASEVPLVEAVSKSATWHVITPPVSVINSGHFMGFTVGKDYLATADGKAATERTVAAYILARAWMMDPANLDAFATLAAKAQRQTKSIELKGIELLTTMHFWQPGIGLTEANVDGEIKLLSGAGTISSGKAPTYEQLIDPSIYPAALAIAQKTVPGVQ